VTAGASVGAEEVPHGRVLLEPTLTILLLALVAMVRREYLPDILLVGGTVVLILVDSRRWQLRTASADPPGRTLGLRALVATALVASVMASLHHGTGGLLDLAFAVVGLVLLGQVWSPGASATAARLDDGTGVPATPRRWWLWPTLGVTLALVELFSFLHQSAPMVDNPRHPTLSTVVEPHLSPWPVRAVVLWVWLAGCWWLLRRVRAWRIR
jgi:hypothetical protein